MVRFAKKVIAKIANWFLFTFLKEKHRKFLSNLLPEKYKQRVRSRIKVGKKVERIKYRLYTLGFVERGLAELEDIVQHDTYKPMRQLAAWELALWYANQYSKDGAKKSLHYLSIAIEGSKDQALLRRAAILKAESHQLLNETEEAKTTISKALTSQKHADLFLAAANVEDTHVKRIEWINKVMELYDLSPVKLENHKEKKPYDNLKTAGDDNAVQQENKVSVIIPVYNAETVVETAIDSMLNQTWKNLEILVVDDHSTDGTRKVIEEYTKTDSRVKLLQTEKNSGAYVARNTGLKQATGEFVTVNDADDWSHRDKIKIQVEHLLQHPKYIANTSELARATENLKFFRRGKPGGFIFKNMSSLMFRRKPVLEKIGYWDSVRFAGDSEFLKRLKIVFGEKLIADIQTGPLSFSRQSESSLTGNSAFGYPGYFMGVRKEYMEAHGLYHENNKDNLYMEFPMKERPFAVPEPMWPAREEKVNEKRHFDVIIASEFRLLGGTNMSNIEEIKVQKEMGLRTGLIQLNRYDLQSVNTMNPKVRKLLDQDQVQMLVYGEKVTCDVLIVRHPPILQDRQKYIPEVEADKIIVIANQTPRKEYIANGSIVYDIKTTSQRVEEYFGKSASWYPIGPLIREAFEKHHADELKYIDLSKTDWINIINTREWRRAKRPDNKVIKIGRHSRDQNMKWPANKRDMLKIYPNSPEYEIHVLGGAEAPKKLLGKLPENWYVYEFGFMEPKEFLAELDVFVYFTHPDWVEAFGRVIFEAMAAGVPVIIPPNYKVLFGDAAIYAEADEVQEKIKKLMQDEKVYEEQVEKAFAYVEHHFGYMKHRERLEEVSKA